ncbi:MAG TPA: Fic family protein [Parvularcula sp.]|nr:Fic family protein [Parvularcula sp.]
MKIPATPPDLWAEFGRMLTAAKAAGPLALTELSRRTARARPVDEKGRYLHWEEFRFKPAEDGLSTLDSWILMRRAREARRIDAPFEDKAGRKFFFVKTDVIERALHDIDSRSRGGVRIDGAAPTQGEAKSFFISSLIEEPFNSSVFEGAVATRDQAKKIIRENRAPKTIGERMILNNYRAIEFLKSKRNAPLTPALICEVHRLITNDTLDDPKKAGVFRDTHDQIVVDDEAGEVLHDPPPAAELSARADALCRFANDDGTEGPFIHPVIRAIIVHFMLAYDHPFVDGNGRTARALFYWAVLRQNYWLLEYVSISKQIREAPVRYGRAFLETETDEGDLTYFIHHQLDMILRAIDALYVFIEEKKSEVAALERLFSGDGIKAQFNHRQLALLNRAARAPGISITIQQHLADAGVSYLTARADLEYLAVKGYFAKGKRGAVSVYRPARDLRRKLDAAGED